jgi:general secretion pathway protein F
VPSFAYEAAGPDGAIGRGVIEAPDRSTAVERIVALGRTPVRVVERAGGGSFAFAPGLPQFGGARERVTLLQELSTLLRAGLSVERSLSVMQGLAGARQTKGALQSVLDGLRGGEPLSAAMKRADVLFPEGVRRLVVAGEASGRLGDVVKRLADAEARNKDLRERAVSAMIYPALLVVVMIAVLVMIFTVVVPRLEPLFAQSGEALPWTAALLMAVSRFLSGYGTALAIVVAAILALVLYAIRQPAGRLAVDRWALSTRLLQNIPQHYHGTQFCRNVAMLLDGGLPLNRALENAQAATGNGYMRQQLHGAVEMVRQGKPLKAALEGTGVFPRAALEFTAVGEETGRLAHMLNEAADLLDKQMQTKVDRLSALLLPVVTIVLGLVVAGIMTGVVGGILAANDLAL